MMSARTIHCGGAAGSANSSASAHPPAVTALKCCDNSRSIAVGNKAGELSLFRVELLMSGGKSSATPDAADQMDSGSINYPDAGGASGDGQPDDDSSSTPRSSSSSIRAPSDPNMAATATTLNSMHARAMQRKSRIVCHAPLLQDLHSASSSRGSDLAHGAIVAIEHLSTFWCAVRCLFIPLDVSRILRALIVKLFHTFSVYFRHPNFVSASLRNPQCWFARMGYAATPCTMGDPRCARTGPHH